MSELVRFPGTEVSIAGVGEVILPATIAREGERASLRYVEFFTASIRNANTRARVCTRGIRLLRLMRPARPGAAGGRAGACRGMD